MAADGSAVLGKVPGSGGCLSLATAKEQLLYETLDPAAYLQADVTADFTGIRLAEIGPDRVTVSGGSGRPAPATYKVSVGYRDGYIGEGQISYAGIGAVARTKLALAIVKERLRLTGVVLREFRGEIIGIDAIDRTARGGRSDPREVRVRAAGRSDDPAVARAVAQRWRRCTLMAPSGVGELPPASARLRQSPPCCCPVSWSAGRSRRRRSPDQLSGSGQLPMCARETKATSRRFR